MPRQLRLQQTGFPEALLARTRHTGSGPPSSTVGQPRRSQFLEAGTDLPFREAYAIGGQLLGDLFSAYMPPFLSSLIKQQKDREHFLIFTLENPLLLLKRKGLLHLFCKMLRKIGTGNKTVFRHIANIGTHILQFPDIPRPIILQQNIGGLLGQLIPQSVSLQKMMQERNAGIFKESTLSR